jgi:hypothetical protein
MRFLDIMGRIKGSKNGQRTTITLKCRRCGAIFYAEPWQVKNNRQFCSLKCKNKNSGLSYAEISKRRREELKSKGLCVDCGLNLVVDDLTVCGVCREKHKVSNNLWRIAHIDVVRAKSRSDSTRARNKILRRQHPERCLYYSAKARAKRYGLPFTIELSDIVIPLRCPILGIQLCPSDKQSTNYSPSLDRIDNTKGYEKGNVAVISHKANTLKSELTLDIIEKLRRYITQGIGYATIGS